MGYRNSLYIRLQEKSDARIIVFSVRFHCNFDTSFLSEEICIEEFFFKDHHITYSTGTKRVDIAVHSNSKSFTHYYKGAV